MDGYTRSGSYAKSIPGILAKMAVMYVPCFSSSWSTSVRETSSPRVSRCHTRWKTRRLREAQAWTLAQERSDGEGTRGSVLAQTAGGPAWIRRAERSRWCDLTSTPPDELQPDETPRDHLRPNRWLGLLPLIHFVREVVGEVGWKPPPLRAAYIFDDPNLHAARYGFIRFQELVDHARTHGYHASLASIPIDYVFAANRATGIIRGNPDFVSISVHGNNHVVNELGRSRSDHDALATAAQALRRASAFEARTGVEVSRVMVPPFEVCNETMMRALLRVGFEGICTETPFHKRSGISVPAEWLLAEWHPADFVAGGLPALPRYPLGRDPDEVVLRAYLDQPLLLFGHHDDLADGLEILANRAALISSLGEVSWLSLGHVSRSNYLRNRNGSRLRLCPLSRQVVLEEMDGVEEMVIELLPTVSAPVDLRLTTEGRTVVSTTMGAGRVARVAGPFSGSVAIELRPLDLIAAESVASPAWRPWPVVRRLMTETRDQAAPLRHRA